MKRLLPLVFLSAFVDASELSHTLSSQGFTGVINTPNAHVMNQGDLTMHFNNQFDNVLRGYDYDKKYNYQENYIFGAGLFPYFEIQGRLAETPGYQRDLSANMKFQLPYKHEYLPNVAFGLQDLGSAANHYGNQYLVMDKELWFVRASLGYGISDGTTEDKKRMDGVFGGVEVKTFDWLYLLAENDSREQFAGIRLEMPKSWSSSIQLSTMLTSNLSDNNKMGFSINLTFPLYEDTNSYRPIVEDDKAPDKEMYVDAKENISDDYKLTNIEIKKRTQEVKKDFTIYQVKDKLEEFGIENITIAVKNSTIYLGYENSVFLFNDLDGLGVAIGLLSKTKYRNFIIEQKKSKTITMTLIGDLEKARIFYDTPNVTNKQLFANSLNKVPRVNLDSYSIYIKNKNDSFLKPRIEFKPVIKTFVGNEFGVFNYKLWLRTQFQTNLYKGIDFTAVGDIHINDSEIDDRRYDYFLKLYENGSHMESVMLHTNNNVIGGINTLSLGTFEENYAGVMDQYIYNTGKHTFKLKAGYFEEFKDGNAYKDRVLGKYKTRELYLAKYSYLLEDYDILGEINFGQYWNKDRGFDIKAKRFFGDVAVYLSYELTTPYYNTMFTESRNHFAGIGIEIPLTLRHTPSFKYGQIKGTNAFNHQIKSTIARSDGTNSVIRNGTYDPEVAIESENYFYNRNRLQLSYIRKHAFRLKESYDKYGK